MSPYNGETEKLLCKDNGSAPVRSKRYVPIPAIPGRGTKVLHTLDPDRIVINELSS